MNGLTDQNSMTGELPRYEASGLFCIPDAHIAATPPGQRLEGYKDQVLDKIAACLAQAARIDCLPVFLGDLFHWPRENPNDLLVALIELFAPVKPYVLVGNHDKYQARYTRDVSLAVLDAAGAVRVISEPGPVFHLLTPTGAALVGASPDATPLPRSFDKEEGVAVVWLTHHGIGFPDFPDRQIRPREIPGVDWIINGHIHRPQPTVRMGSTTWANPGNITRLSFARRTLTRVPAASIWRPGMTELEKWPVPHLPFYSVFPDQEFPPEIDLPEQESRFVKGLERLAWKRTREGQGLREFLAANLNPEHPETSLIWELYQEAANAKDTGHDG
jgi:DNA repair exonuclease SbcCD nuclease subunit